MSALATSMTVICTVLGVFGASVTLISGWTVHQRCQSLEGLYFQPEVPQFLREHANVSSTSQTTWEHLASEWTSYQLKDVALISLCLAAGFIQCLVSCVVYCYWGSAGDKVLASRLLWCYFAVLLVFIGCAAGLITVDHWTLYNWPSELKHAMKLSGTVFLLYLEFGINSFIIWILINSIVVIIGSLILLYYLRRHKVDSFYYEPEPVILSNNGCTSKAENVNGNAAEPPQPPPMPEVLMTVAVVSAVEEEIKDDMPMSSADDGVLNKTKD